MCIYISQGRILPLETCHKLQKCLSVPTHKTDRPESKKMQILSNLKSRLQKPKHACILHNARFHVPYAHAVSIFTLVEF